MTAELPPVPPRVGAALSVLRHRHERVTPARRAVLEALDSTSEHLNAEEIIALAVRLVPGVHRATVYRALATLGELGLVAHTHLGGTATVYHLVLPAAGVRRHAHLQCTTCGTIIDIPAEALVALQDRLDGEHGFLLEPGHTALLGTCLDCRRPPE